MLEPDPLTNRERSDPRENRSTGPERGSDSASPLDPPTVRSHNSGSSVDRAGSQIAPSSTPLPKAGDHVDFYELETSIGIGGMGAVFRALDLRLDRHVAIKVLPSEQSNDVEAVQRFYQEGRAAARLDHENIARVFTIGHDTRHHYIAFEYIEGTTIRQQVTERSGPVSVTEAINYTLQMADALVHASERGVVHRDIKPSNIIITPQGRAKLVDMGLARRFESGVDDGLTQSGMTLGTFDYISPEQARDPRLVDVRSDLYSLGCTLFFMLAGHPPFPDGTVLQKLLQHQEEPPPDLREINAEVPKELSAIVVKLMAKDRERRYQSPEQLARDLLMVAGSLGLRSLSPEGLVWMAPAPVVQPAWERHLIWAIPALAFGLIVGVLVWSSSDTGRSNADGLSKGEAKPSTTKLVQLPTDNEPAAPTIVAAKKDTAEQKPEAAGSLPEDDASEPPPVAKSIPAVSAKDRLDMIAKADSPANLPQTKPLRTVQEELDEDPLDIFNKGPATVTAPDPIDDKTSNPAGSGSKGTSVGSLESRPAAPLPMPMPMPTAGSNEADQVTRMPIMPPTPVDPKDQTAQRDNNGEVAVGTTSELLANAATKPKPPAPEIPKGVDREPSQDPAILKSREAFLKALGEPNARGGVLRIAGDVEWELPSTLIRVIGSWRIQGVPGTSRPRLRFLPKHEEGSVKGTSVGETALFDLRSGSLHLDGVDIVLPENNAPQAGGWSAFLVAPSTDLGLTNGTVTIEGDKVSSAIVSVQGPSASATETNGQEKASNTSSATIRLQNSLLRSGGDLFRVKGDSLVTLDLDNLAVSTTGSLLHSGGSRRRERPEKIVLVMRSVTTRNVGGLIFLDSSEDDPTLPVVDVNVRDSILATNSQGAPLIRVDSQDSLNSLRDNIVWEGLRVGYHDISIYRRDQSSQVGTVPNLYDRPSWTVAVGVREVNSVHGDLMFRRTWPTSRPAWMYGKDDAEVDPESPASSSGPVLTRLPNPPERL